MRIPVSGIGQRMLWSRMTRPRSAPCDEILVLGTGSRDEIDRDRSAAVCLNDTLLTQ
jgi:hypothetical protein